MPDLLPETPRPVTSIYQARGEEVDEYRPLFTGDVLESSTDAEPRHVIVLQHPCALRVRGVEIAPTVLVATVRQVPSLRSDWAAESMRVMPLPELFDDGVNHAAQFLELDVLPGSRIGDWRRIAVLSLGGVNLLLQRWVRHNSRVVVRTLTFSEVVTGPFEEADLTAEWCADLDGRTPRGVSLEHDFAEWLRDRVAADDPRTWQQLLEQPQERPAVRRAVRQEIKRRLDGE